MHRNFIVSVGVFIRHLWQSWQCHLPGRRCKVCIGAKLGTEWNSQHRSAHQPHCVHQHSFLTVSLVALQSPPIPQHPAQDDCKRIEDCPSLTSLHYTPLSSTPFPLSDFRHWQGPTISATSFSVWYARAEMWRST
jgi:hypothetical protein